MTEYETLHGEIIAATGMAVLVRTPDGEEIWIPRSVCDGGAGLDEGDKDPEVAVWFLEKEGIA